MIYLRCRRVRTPVLDYSWFIHEIDESWISPENTTQKSSMKLISKWHPYPMLKQLVLWKFTYSIKYNRTTASLGSNAKKNHPMNEIRTQTLITIIEYDNPLKVSQSSLAESHQPDITGRRWSHLKCTFSQTCLHLQEPNRSHFNSKRKLRNYFILCKFSMFNSRLIYLSEIEWAQW